MLIRKLPRSLGLLTLSMIIANIASHMYWPLMPLYLESLGATVQEVGLFFTIQTIFAICFRILGGWISDHVGRLPTVAIGGIVGQAAIMAFALAPTWQWAMLGALLAAMGSALIGPSFQAFTAEQAPAGKTSSTYGLVKGLFVMCMVIGPLLGGFMVEQFGYKIMLRMAVVIFTVATVLRVTLARGTRPDFSTLQPQEMVRDVRALVGVILGGGLLLWLFLVDGLADAGQQFANPFLPKYVTEIGGLGEGTYSILFALMALTSAIAMWPGGIFADRFGERVSIALGMGLSSLVWCMMLLVPATWMFVLAFTLGGIATALIDPAFSALVSKAVPRDALGMTWGIFWTALGVAAIPAPYLGGLLYEYVAPQATFIIAAICPLLVVPLALWKLRIPAKAVEQTAEAVSTTLQ